MSSITEKLKQIPKTPGVYIYKDAKERILYVGKAKNLRARTRSYFRKIETSDLQPTPYNLQPSNDLDPAKQEMVTKIADIETISVDTETEALILEANLIRKHQPPYNVVLRDDKYYLFIKITTNEEIPRVFPVRKIKQDGARYFGPYSSARSVRQTLKLLRRIFPFQGEKEQERDVIFPHPLFEKSSDTTYRDNIENIIRFLRGQRQEIMETLERGMKRSSQNQEFEQAAIFRNQLQAIERLEGNQKVFLPRQESFDVVSIARATNRSAANIFQIRKGKLLGKQTFLLSHRASAPLEDTLRQFLLQYYRVAQDIPGVILVPTALTDFTEIGFYIAPEGPPTFSVPMRGKKKQLLAMGETNAQLLLDEQDAAFQTDLKQKQALTELAKAIRMPDNPLRRIETYDISNIQGTLATASMVVFIEGASTPKLYRKFRLELGDTPNDFASLQETLRRRFGNHSSSGWELPDLIMIDGGKGQLSSSKKILDELGLHIPIISLAKQEEEIFLPGESESIRLPYDSPALYLIQRMRDEAHRFTITYHRLLRSKQQRKSLLDEVPGIGPKTKKRLIATFGSLKGIREAEDSAIAKIIGAKKTKILRDYL